MYLSTTYTQLDNIKNQYILQNLWQSVCNIDTFISIRYIINYSHHHLRHSSHNQYRSHQEMGTVVLWPRPRMTEGIFCYAVQVFHVAKVYKNGKLGFGI